MARELKERQRADERLKATDAELKLANSRVTELQSRLNLAEVGLPFEDKENLNLHNFRYNSQFASGDSKAHYLASPLTDLNPNL